MAKHSAAHPGFKAVAAKIGKKSGIRNPGAVLAAASRKASPAAKRANPRLNRVKGAAHDGAECHDGTKYDGPPANDVPPGPAQPQPPMATSGGRAPAGGGMGNAGQAGSGTANPINPRGRQTAPWSPGPRPAPGGRPMPPSPPPTMGDPRGPVDMTPPAPTPMAPPSMPPQPMPPWQGGGGSSYGPGMMNTSTPTVSTPAAPGPGWGMPRPTPQRPMGPAAGRGAFDGDVQYDGDLEEDEGETFGKW